MTSPDFLRPRPVETDAALSTYDLAQPTGYERVLARSAKLLQQLRQEFASLSIDLFALTGVQMQSLNFQILNLMSEYPIHLPNLQEGEHVCLDGKSDRTIEASIAMMSFVFEKAVAQNIPIISWWSGKDWASLMTVVQALEIASIPLNLATIYVVDTPFITEETRNNFRKAVEMGIPIVRVATTYDQEKKGWTVVQEEGVTAHFGKVVTEVEITFHFGPGWEQPENENHGNVMDTVKGLPTNWIMYQYMEAKTPLVVARGTRGAENIKHAYEMPIGRRPDGMWTYVQPLIDLSREEMQAYNRLCLVPRGLTPPKRYTDPSRAREQFVMMDEHGTLCVVPPGTKGASMQYVIEYPNGLCIACANTSCAHDLVFLSDKTVEYPHF